MSAEFKHKVAHWNRRLGWFTFPTLVIGSLLYYGPRQGWLDIPKWPGDAITGIFTIAFLVHSAFAWYLFGFPRPSTHIRIVHIYIGYVVFVFTMLSQGLVGKGWLHDVTYGIMWVVVLAHVALSTRFALQRRARAIKDPELALRS